ncbi:hypothetical protein J6590_101956 [Homalodisca vitripennis]|nr:hypothetical protein J6590_007059 [Homalodisca vitripennis]KAG8314033.1 hypothetical protein J6590_101956 [Homalodisca vitripennis]
MKLNHGEDTLTLLGLSLPPSLRGLWPPIIATAGLCGVRYAEVRHDRSYAAVWRIVTTDDTLSIYWNDALSALPVPVPATGLVLSTFHLLPTLWWAP